MTLRAALVDTDRSVLQNTLIRGKPSRQSKALFSSNGFTPMGGMGQNYKTRKGNTARRRITVLNILPTSPQNEVKSQYGVAMSISTSTLTNSRSEAIKSLSKQASTLAALLSVIDLLEQTHQEDTLWTCASMAERMADDVAALADDLALTTGGAA